MSRIGKLPISIPAGVTVTLKDNVVTVKGPKGEMTQFVNPAINVEIEDGQVVLKENENEMLDKCTIQTVECMSLLNVVEQSVFILLQHHLAILNFYIDSRVNEL